MFKKLNKLFPTIIFILVAVIVSMMVLSFFNISLAETRPGLLNRSAVFEGFKEGQEDPVPVECNKFLSEAKCPKSTCTWSDISGGGKCENQPALPALPGLPAME